MVVGENGPLLEIAAGARYALWSRPRWLGNAFGLCSRVEVYVVPLDEQQAYARSLPTPRIDKSLRERFTGSGLCAWRRGHKTGTVPS